MGEMRPPPPSVNVRYFEKLAKKDWLKNLQTAYFAQRVALKHARTKSHFVRYFGVGLAEHPRHRAGRAHAPAVRASWISPRRSSPRGSRPRCARPTRRPPAPRRSSRPKAITALPEYLQAPLEVEAKCTSPKVTRYLELILKADRLLTYARSASPRRRDRDERLRSPGHASPCARSSPCPGRLPPRDRPAQARARRRLPIAPAKAPRDARQADRAARRRDAAPDTAAAASTEAARAVGVRCGARRRRRRTASAQRGVGAGDRARFYDW